MRRALVAGLAMLASLAAVPSHAEMLDTRWYIGLLGSYVIADDERNTDDGVGAQLLFGRAVSEHLNFELRAFGDQMDRNVGEKQEQYGFGTDLLYMFSRGRFSPFAMIGFGGMRDFTKNNGIDEDAIHFYGDLGLGFMWQMSQHGTALRFDTRYRPVDNDISVPGESSFEDWEFNLGLQIPLGSGIQDSDGDGVADGIDRCPNTPPGRAVDSTGCPPDSDGDGVPDAIDQCPDTRPGTPVDFNGCPSDSDGDGVPDGLDACPGTPAGVLVDARGCAIDSDGDGVIDAVDQCPNTRPNVQVDYKGCEIKDEIVLDGVHFELDSARLSAGSENILDQAAGTLRRYPTMTVEIGGHTDSTGSDAYNRNLSQRRADAVRSYLIAQGISGSRMTTRGYGESQPVASNATREGRAKNRRVVFRILTR